jgi:AcrR family transcriptional regulator
MRYRRDVSETAGRPRPSYGEGRQALIDAAIRVVARSGLRGLTYRAVAREAGVTQGLVAHHFGSREQLIRDALEHAARTSIERSTLEPGSGLLDEVAAGLAQLVADDVEGQAFQFELALEARRNPGLRADARALYESYLAATERSLAAVGVPTTPAFTRLVFAALDGLVFQQLLFDRPELTEAAVTELRELLRRERDR